MERGDPGLGDIAHAVHRASADMEDERHRQALHELDVQVLEIALVVIRAHQVSGGVIGDRQCIGTGLDLGHAEQDGRLLHAIERELGLARIVKGHEQEGLHSEAVIAQRPRPHGLADDRDLVAELAPQDADRLDHAVHVRVHEEVVGDADVVHVLPDRLAHAHRRPIVLLLPLHIAAERRRFLDDREDRHDAVEAELGIAGCGEARHQLRIAVGEREVGVH